MRTYPGRIFVMLALAAMMATPGAPEAAPLSTAAELDADVAETLKELYASTPAARTLGASAKAILVFPGVVKAGFIGGAQTGEGALRVGGRTAAYYRTTAVSYGLQAGVQKFGYALFFMTDNALESLDRTGGFEIGAGPSVVVVDEGRARSLTTTTARDDVYAFVFDQKGLMAGAGLQGSKITRISK